LYISKIHLQGFKSFLHKTDLEFGSGVTAVVGPNGCGKSNIVDAIRWVLGEQKTSLLRSAKMEDIIFNGTKNKKPLSYCEASMLIHNDMGILPLEYNDVEIARRHYRSGESEFYINNTLCRLKDIQNLFVDTGMSSNAYSVIELKMVDSILSNNTVDRRQMFEEAAGINNYKQQRKTAIKKMETTQYDMERINDIILEVNKTIKNLQLQVTRYRRHEKLTEKLESLNIIKASTEIQTIKEEQLPINKNIKKLKAVQLSVSNQMNIDEALIEQVKNNFEDKKNKLNDVKIEISNVEKKILTTNSNLLISSEKHLGNKNQYQYFQDELKNTSLNEILLDDKVSEFEDKINKLKPEIGKRKLKFKTQEKKYIKARSKLDEIQKQQTLLKSEKDDIFLKIREEEASLERINNLIIEKNRSIETLNNEKIILSADLENTKANINLIRLNLERINKNKIEILEQLNINKNNYANLKDNLANLREKQLYAISKQDTIRQQVKFYKQIITNHEGYPEGVKNILSKNDKYPFVMGTLGDLITVNKSYHLAVESALGEFSNYLVVKSMIDAEKILVDSPYPISVIALDNIPKLKVSNLEYPARSLISVIQCSKKVKYLLDILINDVCILPSNKTEPTNKEMDMWKWVTKSGRYFEHGFINKKTGKECEPILGRKQNLIKLEKEMNDNSKIVDKIKKEIKTLSKRADASCEKMKKMTEKVNGVNNTLSKSKAELNQQDFISLQQSRQILKIKNKIINTDKQLIELNIHSIRINDGIELSNIKYDDAKKQSDAQTKYITTDRKNINTEHQNLQDIRINLLEIEKEEEGIKQRLGMIKSQKKELLVRIKKYNSELIQIDTENKSLKISISKNKTNLKKMNGLMEIKNNNRAELELMHDRLYEELQILQSEIRVRQKQKDDYVANISNYEIIMLEKTNEIKQIYSRIKELYNKDLSNVPISIKDINIESLNEKIMKTQRSLENIGPINLAVNEEYAEESDRYNFLIEQYRDLEQSEQLINETIHKLDYEAKMKFVETFELIQINFKDTYSSFFDGGKGCLQLVEENDPLETEIEIIAQPPGKKPQTLQMLSAGEKALTAIALLFAIYLVKPSPFCILDEVDAPLDDNNISKFAQALQEFSNKTQFIVVTHNKLTMEKADYMYGITQEEEGISKIVSVKMKNSENR